MFRLNSLALTQFKNYRFGKFDFSEKVVGITGLNGSGKTSLLDAIYYCCFTKSYFAGSDAGNVLLAHDGFRLESLFEHHSHTYNICCIYRGNKKEFFNNEVAYTRLAKHIGLLPAVMIAPDDIELITGASELRRKFIDTLICQLNADYMQQLIIYNKVLQQRNGLLRQFGESGSIDHTLLSILNEQLTAPAGIVFDHRKMITAELSALVLEFYNELSKNREIVSVTYESQLSEKPLQDWLLANLQKDLALSRTTAGIHRDELKFSLYDQPFKQVASQGQRKTLLFALKLAEFEILKRHTGKIPLLLLDDIFEKLDEQRMQQLLHKVCVENRGQVFITDTHANRLEGALRETGTTFQMIRLEEHTIG